MLTTWVNRAVFYICSALFHSGNSGNSGNS